MIILNVAEKPSVAKSISSILSKYINTTKSPNKYIMNYRFKYQNTQMIFTSVLGHLFTTDFTNASNWALTDPRTLFHAPITKKINEPSIKANIQNLCQKVNQVIIWTDCDREGENIAKEIVEVVLEKCPNMEIRRARFNAITYGSITGALDSLGVVNERESDAVEARIELDLRLGSAFTRIQTLRMSSYIAKDGSSPNSSNKNAHNVEMNNLALINAHNEKSNEKNVPHKEHLHNNNENFTHDGDYLHDENNVNSHNDKINEQKGVKGRVISYGPCQVPTLGFVVDRMLAKENFIPEDFFTLTLTVQKKLKDVFTWHRGNIFDKNFVIHMFSLLKTKNGIVTEASKKPKEKKKPLPLRTVEFQKSCASLFKMSSHAVMTIAEKLYTKGYISYPRTETDSFPSNFNHKEIVAALMPDPSYAPFCDKLGGDLFMRPFTGKNNDMAHSPIYPLKNGIGLTGDERRIYDFVARRYLACISKNAVGEETCVTVLVGREEFKIVGLKIKERNYLEIYTFDKWDEKAINDYFVNEVILIYDSADDNENIKLCVKTNGDDSGINDNLQSKKINDNLQSKKINDNLQSKNMDDNLQSKKINDNLQSKKINDNLQSKKINDNFRDKRINDLNVKVGGMLDIQSGKTTPPDYLTEPELIAQMDKHGIGTDATIAEHIQKILTRKYAYKKNNKYFIATGLGLGLICGYKKIGLEYFTRPFLRGELERSLKNVCEGSVGREELVEREVDVYLRYYDVIVRGVGVIREMIVFYEGLSNNNGGGDDDNKKFNSGNNKKNNGGSSNKFNNGSNKKYNDSKKNYELNDEIRVIKKSTKTKENQIKGDYQIKNHYQTKNDYQIKNENRIKGDYQTKNDYQIKRDYQRKNENQTKNDYQIKNQKQIKNDNQTKNEYQIKNDNQRNNTKLNENDNQKIKDEYQKIKCKCKANVKKSIVTKDTENKGREFYSCAKWPSGCGYFEWADQTDTNKENVTVKCNCGYDPQVMVANTDANRGRKFYRCKKVYKPCKFFEWID